MVPLAHDDPAGPSPSVALTRQLPQAEPTALLWLLDGGSGRLTCPAAEGGRGAGSSLPDGSSCAYTLARSVLTDLQTELDLGCIMQVEPIGLDGDPGLNLTVFRERDAWGG